MIRDVLGTLGSSALVGRALVVAGFAGLAGEGIWVPHALKRVAQASSSCAGNRPAHEDSVTASRSSPEARCRTLASTSSGRADGSVPQSSPAQETLSGAREGVRLMRRELRRQRSAARKARICRTFEAADGTRTHDLLHGKQTYIGRPWLLSACKSRRFGFGELPALSPDFVPFRRGCVNQSSIRSLARRTRCAGQNARVPNCCEHRRGRAAAHEPVSVGRQRRPATCLGSRAGPPRSAGDQVRGRCLVPSQTDSPRSRGRSPTPRQDARPFRRWRSRS
jgi:hypothetical protein